MAQPSATITASDFGPWQPIITTTPPLGLVIDGFSHRDPSIIAPRDYVDDLLLTDAYREQFFELIDRAGLVVCHKVGSSDRTHAVVRGRSSRGRLSQGEHYHHDGCSGPDKPRVVEIRCPYQAIARHTATAIARFPDTVHAMLRVLPAELRAADRAVTTWADRLAVDGAIAPTDYDMAQGAINRIVRLAMSAEVARSFFRDVDDAAGAYRAAWAMGESRFIANANATRTMQHRRAYLEAPGRANGHLVKRWPAGPAMHE
jgi:hypothetical protein